MLVLLFRLLIFIAIIMLAYTVYKYIASPQRKLEAAQSKKEFYFMDEPDNVKRNFLMTYKGLLFEGEKYLGATEESFDVVNIIVHTNNPSELKGLERNDLYFLEKEMLIHYPYAEIEWKHPINKLFIKKP